MVRRALLLFGALSVTLGASCSLILDFDDPVGQAGDGGPTDAPASDGMVGPDAPTSLPCTLFEANDTIETAAFLSPADYAAVGLCPAATDVDYYRLDLPAEGGDRELAVVVDFGAVGAVELLDSLGQATLATGEDREADGSYDFSLQVPPGTYILRVTGSDALSGNLNYSLSVTSDPAPTPDAGA